MSALLEDAPAISGKSAYLNSPYVTAGDRLYMVGHQDGSFPEIGWHVKGEMGGIWDHPIKLMDGFEAQLIIGDQEITLDKATSFKNYPFTNSHLYDLKDMKLQVERFQFVPDGTEGILIQYQITNRSEKERKINFRFTGHTDLRPVWLGERTNMIDHEDKGSFDSSFKAWFVKDDENPWYVMFGANLAPETHTAMDDLGNGFTGSTTYSLSLAPNASAMVNFTIAGSYISKAAVQNTFKHIQKNSIRLFNEKQQRYEILASLSKLTIPDKQLGETFEWLKYNSDWLIRTVPEIGTGITAGIPDYPWWFGVDSEYALRGYMAIGQADAVYSTIRLIDSVSNAVNGNGRIIHEMSTNGAVFNKGNINETPQFASLVWEIYQWNGDRDFLIKYFPTIKKGLHWLMSENDANNNLFPDGFGMMEIHGLDSEMIDVAAYTQRAFEDAGKIARELGDAGLAQEYEELAKTLKLKINNEFWSEEFNSYADFIGTDEQALHLIDDAIVRADTLNKPWAIAELEQTRKAILKNPSDYSRPFVLHHNWVVNTPMEMNIADSPKAERALRTAEKFVNPYGMFVTGIDRDESAGSDDGSFKGSKLFSYTGAVMTLPTGVQAIAENNYGNPDKALNYLKRMSRTFSYALPGSMYEVSPDYGMITQAWNIYAFAIPIVHQFFGIHPKAAEKRVRIQLQMPSEWNSASLENVVIADNKISITYNKTDDKTTVIVTQTNTEWTIDLVFSNDGRSNFEFKEGLKQSTSDKEIIFSSSDITLEVKKIMK